MDKLLDYLLWILGGFPIWVSLVFKVRTLNKDNLHVFSKIMI